MLAHAATGHEGVRQWNAWMREVRKSSCGKKRIGEYICTKMDSHSNMGKKRTGEYICTKNGFSQQHGVLT
jgi:hypothetical protein|tara:strand:- start:32 stop:241 length:210 start_codon:yes stop_codon:yes gene_type:complete